MSARKCECGKPCLFRVRLGKKVSADKWHDLCFKCSRVFLQRMRIEQKEKNA